MTGSRAARVLRLLAAQREAEDEAARREQAVRAIAARPLADARRKLSNLAATVRLRQKALDGRRVAKELESIASQLALPLPSAKPRSSGGALALWIAADNLDAQERRKR